MKLIEEIKNGNDRRKIYCDSDNDVYELLDMGEYIGHKSRDVFDSIPENFKLMFSSHVLEDGNKVSLRALIDPYVGNYISIKMKKNNEERVITLDNGFVTEDSIYIFDGDKMFSSKHFKSSLTDRISVDEYLKTNHKFVDDSGSVFCESSLTIDDLIINFLEKSQEFEKGMGKSK